MQQYYHGTYADTFYEFRETERGYLGRGVYFLSNKDACDCYGDNVVTVSLDIKKPWIIPLRYDTELGDQLDIDYYAVEPLLSLPNGERLIEALKAGDGYFGDELRNELISLGYDSIKGTYPDGIEEIVVFDPANISITDFEIDYVLKREAAKNIIKNTP